jgi:tyrosyl-tRNA synthetase
MPHTTSENNLNIIDFLVNTGICSSKREAREFVSSSSITINEEKINDDSIFVNKDMAINNDTLVVRKGKKKYFIVKLV